MAQSVDREAVRPLRRAEFDRLVEAGVFREERVELLYGMVLRMSPHGPAHDGVLQKLQNLLFRALDPRAELRVQSAFAASDGSEPEPDLVVVPPGDYTRAHPSKALLIVEIADSSLAHDRNVKAKLYAECGIEEYWIVNLTEARIEVYTQPEPDGFQRVRSFLRGERLSLVAFADVVIAVDDVLP
jgi:Uma2 family endonuclease